MHLIWQVREQRWLQPVTYCKKSPCVCGNNCHENTGLHTRITGALTSDEWSAEVPCQLPLVDDALFELAMASLGGREVLACARDGEYIFQQSGAERQ